jgi:hypothetical protein
MKINPKSRTTTGYLVGCIAIVAFVLLACESSRNLGAKKKSTTFCSDSSLLLSVKRIIAVSIDSIIVDLALENKCTDSVIIMRDYTKPRFYFPNGTIQSSPVQTTPLYPSIDWDKSAKGVKEIYIENRCNPLISQYNILIIPPNESKVITCSLKNLGYNGFSKNVRYDFFVSFDVSNQIKSYCPFVWTGFTKSSLYNFIIQ